MNIDKVVHAIRDKALVDDSSIPHRLFHLVPFGKVGGEEFAGGTNPANNKLASVELGSREIASRVYQAVAQDESLSLAKLLAMPTRLRH